MRRLLGVLLCALSLVACSSQPENSSQGAAVDRDTLTRRQRDSITATLPVPGARAVGRALEAADAAAARAAETDAEAQR